MLFDKPLSTCKIAACIKVLKHNFSLAFIGCALARLESREYSAQHSQQKRRLPAKGSFLILETLMIEVINKESWRREADRQMQINREAERVFDTQWARRNMSPIRFVDVTLRDGLQQDDIHKGNLLDTGKYEGLSVDDRIRIFDLLVDAGMQTIEVGHFGNAEDIPFGKTLVEHINRKSAEGDTRYDTVRIQVLFGTQKALIEEGIKALDGFDPDRVVIHVYSRVSEQLRQFAQEQPYTTDRSIADITAAAQIALDAGFSHLSISGEGAVDVTTNPDEVIRFYKTTMRNLFTYANPPETINVNLANTFGSPAEGEWDVSGLEYFDRSVKAVARDFPGTTVTTSAHCHRDFGMAEQFSLDCIRAGFDIVEGAFIGMGERKGNTSIVDFVTRVMQSAQMAAEYIERCVTADEVPEDIFTARAIAGLIVSQRRLTEEVVRALPHYYDIGRQIGEIAGTRRFWSSYVADPRSGDAGSGPHQEANAKYAADPLNKPLLQSYGRTMFINAMFGLPDAIEVIHIVMERMKAITAMNHASGGNGQRLSSGQVVRAPQEQVDAHVAITEARRTLALSISAAKNMFSAR